VSGPARRVPSTAPVYSATSSIRLWSRQRIRRCYFRPTSLHWLKLSRGGATASAPPWLCGCDSSLCVWTPPCCPVSTRGFRSALAGPGTSSIDRWLFSFPQCVYIGLASPYPDRHRQLNTTTFFTIFIWLAQFHWRSTLLTLAVIFSPLSSLA
jgi:hypothetical protein